jgi:topoisomerase-4 subunit A
MIPKEDVVVVVTKYGYIKRTSFRSYSASEREDLTIKENDYVIGMYEMNTLDTILVFTNGGNYLHIPVHMIPDLKWKDMPKHVSNIIEVPNEEQVISCIPAYDFKTDKNIIFVSKNSIIKRTKLKELQLQRFSKATSCMKLKEDDELISVIPEDYDTIFMTTNTGYGLSFKTEEIPLIGAKASGVKGMKLKDDYVVSVNNFDYNKHEFISIITNKGTGKRVRLNEFELSTRTRRGVLVLREVKSNPYKVIKTFIEDSKNQIGLKNGEISIIKLTELPISDRYSTGTSLVKHAVNESFLVQELKRINDIKEQETIEELVEEKEEVRKKDKVSLEEIDDRLMTIDDFLK